MVGFDQRGFGQSEGIRGRVESFEHIINDHVKYIHKLQEHHKYDVPMFLLGNSLGGAVCTMLDKQGEIDKYCKGIIYLAPYIDVKDPSLIDKLRPGLKMLQAISPNKQIRMGL